MYEFDYEVIDINEEQFNIIKMDLADVGAISTLIKNKINERATDGWEPLYPFSVPQIWFKREKTDV